jgi:hypothetical protein
MKQKMSSDFLKTERKFVEIVPFFQLQKEGIIIEIATSTATVARSFLVDLLQPQLRSVRFDEGYYREKNEDLREAEARGELRDLHSHYVEFGFFENRLPCAVEVDGSFYARAYPDVAVAVLESTTISCQVHFETTGFAEGRIPRRGWSFADLMNGQ